MLYHGTGYVLDADMVKMLSMEASIEANPQYKQDSKDLEAEGEKKIAAGASKEEMQQRIAKCISSLPDALATRPARVEEVEGFIDCVRVSTGMEPKYKRAGMEPKYKRAGIPWLWLGGACVGSAVLFYWVFRSGRG